MLPQHLMEKERDDEFHFFVTLPLTVITLLHVGILIGYARVVYLMLPDFLPVNVQPSTFTEALRLIALTWIIKALAFSINLIYVPTRFKSLERMKVKAKVALYVIGGPCMAIAIPMLFTELRFAGTLPAFTAIMMAAQGAMVIWSHEVLKKEEPSGADEPAHAVA